MFQKKILILALLSSAALQADAITYSVSVNTSSLAGTAGYLDLQFNAGNVIDPATAVMFGFSSDGTPGNPDPSSFNYMGRLPGTVTLSNANLNDLFQNFLFGNTLSFFVTFSGGAIDSPTTANTTRFAFSIYDASQAPLLTDDPAGFLATVDVGGGSAYPSNNAPAFAELAQVPEPSTAALLGAALLAIGVLPAQKHTSR